MNLRDLRYLVTLADTRHFGRAAERCFVSQPTLSAQVRKLEEFLGVTLLERQPRRVALTEVGERVVEIARGVLQGVETMTEVAKLARDPLAGRLRVGLIPTIAPYLLPGVAPRLRRALPNLGLLLVEQRTVPLLTQLREGQIDLAILALGAPIDGLRQRRLYEEPFVVALPAQHPLTKKPVLRPEDLGGETLLLLEDGHCLRDQALAVCAHVAAKEAPDFRATSLETLRQMVAAGLGVTLLPQLATRGPFGRTRGLVLRPFAKPVPHRNVGALWRASSARALAIEAVCATIEAYMAEA